MALVVGQIARLGEILEPEQFTFTMQMAIQPLFQLKIPGHLCSPADVHFEKECVTAVNHLKKNVLIESCLDHSVPSWIKSHQYTQSGVNSPQFT